MKKTSVHYFLELLKKLRLPKTDFSFLTFFGGKIDFLGFFRHFEGPKKFVKKFFFKKRKNTSFCFNFF